MVPPFRPQRYDCAMLELSPLARVDARPLFRPLGVSLVELLRGLDPADWDRPTVCSLWGVRDIVAHLLDTGLRRLSYDRDTWPPPGPGRAIGGYADLVGWLNELNATWVGACRRLGPQVLVELVADLEVRLADWVEGAPIDGKARFAVDWAGSDQEARWLDLGRELTERWIHQQQIRLALGRGPVADEAIDGAVFDVLARSWPRGLAAVDEPVGATISVALAGVASRQYVLRRAAGQWELLAGLDPDAACCLGLDAETAWLAWSKGLAPEGALARAALEGRRDLALAVLRSVAVMA